MEHNVLGGSSIFSSMLGLEMPLPQQQNPQNPQNTQNHPHQLHHPQMIAYAHHESDHQHSQTQPSVQHAYPYAPSKHKQQSPLSDEDELGFAGDDSTSDGKRKISPWHRMKWTDNMVKLLIMAVFYIGDEAVSEGNNDPAGKKKAGGLAQKKGKWKSVSRAMMEKGFYVSPQQCEDKFNDLNKRYKRVTDILGKGTACKVVENQSLLDTMDLSQKRKEEVRKLLNSKHLFFREMCAYHNSCGHGSSGVSPGTNQSPELANGQAHIQPQQATQQSQQRCSHSSENAQIATDSKAEMEGSQIAKRQSNEDEDEEDDDESDEDEEYDEEEGEDEAIEGNSRHQNGHGLADDDDHDDKHLHKRIRTEEFSSSSSLIQQVNVELASMFQDGARSPWDKKQWIKLRLVQLEEQKVRYQWQAFELEKQRLKWVKFSSKKEREMERAKLENERELLENERMVLRIRQKELELPDLQHHHQNQQLSSNKRSDPSSITG